KPASDTDTVWTGPHASSATGTHARRARTPIHSSTSATPAVSHSRPVRPSDGRPVAVRYRPGASPAVSARFHWTAQRPATGAAAGAASRYRTSTVASRIVTAFSTLTGVLAPRVNVTAMAPPTARAVQPSGSAG